MTPGRGVSHSKHQGLRTPLTHITAEGSSTHHINIHSYTHTHTHTQAQAQAQAHSYSETSPYIEVHHRIYAYVILSMEWMVLRYIEHSVSLKLLQQRLIYDHI